MRQIVGRLKARLGSWDEVCTNDRARLRLNLVLFSFVISMVFLVVSIHTAIRIGIDAAAGTIVFGIVTFVLFLCQFFRKDYSSVIAWLFGLMSIAMAAVLLYTGGIENTGHIWICVLPIVGTMMVPLRTTLVYNGALLVMLMVVFKSPLHTYLPAEYSVYMRTMFPISILILTLCNYVAEYTRDRTQKQLIIMTERLRDNALTDPLTGIYNRRALTAHFGEGEESAFGLSFAMLDLDYFKNVNDTYGHEAGDKLLCHLVTLINMLKPAGAQLYRWGGEEFLLVLKSGSAELLDSVLHSIHGAVADTPLVVAGQGDEPDLTIAATVSIGGVVAERGDSIEACINRADEQMYIAKSSGRNRVVVKQSAASSQV